MLILYIYMVDENIVGLASNEASSKVALKQTIIPDPLETFCIF